MEIATSREGLQPICDRNPHFPSPRTIYRWILENESFRQSYARAKTDQKWLIADEILPICDTPQMGEIVTHKPNPLNPDGPPLVERKMVDMIEHRKLQIDARKWMLAHLDPKKWGNAPSTDDGAGRLDEFIAATMDEPKKEEQ